MFPMNFKYFAFSVSLLFAMVLIVFLLTMIGHQFLSKEQLETIINPTFFTGFVVIGYFLARKAVPHEYIHASIMSLILVAFMALFLDVMKQIPPNLWKFLGLSFALMQIGILSRLALLKIRQK